MILAFIPTLPLLIAYIFILGIIVRSISNLINLISNLKWILLNFDTQENTGEEKTNFYICIPMLREQSIVEDTLKYFSELNYPIEKYQIFVVTTQREIKEKLEGKKLIDHLAKDIVAKAPISEIVTKYGKLFSHNELIVLSTKSAGNPLNIVRQEIQTYYDTSPSTYDLAVKSALKINDVVGRKLIEVINYPMSDGVMSHQINYLIDLLEGKESKTAENNFFAIYNADSRPNKNTLYAIDNTISKFENTNNFKPNIIQQSSLFEYVNSTRHNIWFEYLLYSASIFQSKWTLTHEISRLRYQSTNTLKITAKSIGSILSSKLSHCVGHGLYIRFKFLVNSRMPTETINEDLPYGFYQSCRGEPIIPIPILEISDSPTTIRSLINQKKVWFWPYIEYWKCRNIVINSGKYRSMFEVTYLTIQGIIVGMIWLFQSFIFLFPLIISVVTMNKILLCSYLLAITLYWIIPVLLIKKFLLKISDKDDFYKKYFESYENYFPATLFCGLLVIYTHSLGPLLCLIDFMKFRYFNVPIVKNKTNR